jgi:hypothetical protein
VKEMFFSGKDPPDTFGLEFGVHSRHIAFEVTGPSPFDG